MLPLNSILIVYVSPDLLYVHDRYCSLVTVLAHCEWLIRSREFLAFCFYRT